MPDKTSLYSFHKIAGLFPAVFLLLFLQAGVEGAVPCYFLPFFGRDVCGMQGGVELALPTASRGCSLVDDIKNSEINEKRPGCTKNVRQLYKKCIVV